MGYIQNIRKKIGHDRLLVVGASVLVFKDGQILLQKRRDDNTWGDHGGCVEIGESPEEAAKRELLEETGLIANNLSFFGIYSGEDMLHTYPNNDKVYIIGIYYVCSDFTGDLLPVTNETVALKWFDINNLPVNINKGVMRPLQDFVKQIRQEENSDIL